MPVRNSAVTRDDAVVTLYVGDIIHPSDGHPIQPNSARLKLSNCTINGSVLPLLEVDLPEGARVFFFDGPFLVFCDTGGNELDRLAPVYDQS